MRVVRMVISETQPDSPAMVIQSPETKGLSHTIKNPAMTLLSESFAAKPMVNPATPIPAMAAPTLNPNWPAAITVAVIKIAARNRLINKAANARSRPI